MTDPITIYKPLYIAIEGIDGTGKTTQVELLKEKFINDGIAVQTVREPGGTPFGESLREIMNKHVDVLDLATLLAMYSARVQLHHEVITPALKSDISIISDRSSLSSWAYQYALSIHKDAIDFTDMKKLEIMLDKVRIRKPYTILLTTDKPEELGRIRNRGDVDMSNFDEKHSNSFKRIQKSMILHSSETSQIVDIINIDDKSIADVHGEIMEFVEDYIRKFLYS